MHENSTAIPLKHTFCKPTAQCVPARYRHTMPPPQQDRAMWLEACHIANASKGGEVSPFVQMVIDVYESHFVDGEGVNITAAIDAAHNGPQIVSEGRSKGNSVGRYGHFENLEIGVQS